MKIVTLNGEVANPNVKTLKNTMSRTEQQFDEFILIENDDGTCIQGMYVKNQWSLEKPESGLKKYVTLASSAEALEIFSRFLEGVDWKTLANWKYEKNKEQLIVLTGGEKRALLGDMQQVMTRVTAKDFTEMCNKIIRELNEKTGISEGWAIFLESYLEDRKDPHLISIREKCKNLI